MRTPVLTLLCGLILSSLPAMDSLAQSGDGPPPAREHTVTRSAAKLELVKAEGFAQEKPIVLIHAIHDKRVIRSNGIPNHKVGRFPNRDNPNRITAQAHAWAIPLSPGTNDTSALVPRTPFGLAVNGVPFDPGTAEWYQGRRSPLWQYEALSGAVPLGLDENHAHVQPTGAYHYHGLPTALLTSLNVEQGKHSPIVGWAADGFPIYALYGYSSPDDPDSDIIELSSSYVLKDGTRPDTNGAPGGSYDGTFVGDYTFIQGKGHLDECNGRFCVTPEFPNGTYAYFLTQNWPVIPRRYRGIPFDGVQRIDPKTPPPRRGSPAHPPQRKPPPQ